MIWRFILEEYGPDIKYIQSNKNIVADIFSNFPININQGTTQECTYEREIVSEFNYIKELLEGIFLINLKFIDQ